MANWSNPLLTSTYTNFVTEVKDRDTDLALQFDGTTSTNIPTNTIRWNSSANRWQKWNGSSWAELTSLYALTGLSTTGNAAIGGTVSGTALIPTANTAPTNGVYLPNANTVGIATNSAGRVFVDASGRFGVGTSTPGTAIDVTAAAGSATAGNIRIAPSTAGQARFHLFNGGATAEWLFGQKTSTDHDFKLSKLVAGSEVDYFTVNTDGNVSIGTTTSSSNHKLEVLGDGNRIVCRNATNGGEARIEAQVQNYTSGSTFTGTSISQYGSTAAGTTAGLSNANLGILLFQNTSCGLITTNGGTPLAFATANTERLRIDSSGRVGIGTTSPLAPIHVASTPTGTSNIYVAPTTPGLAAIEVYNGGPTCGWRIGQRSSSDHDWSLDQMVAGVAYNKFQVSATGRVGIGTTSPSTSLEIKLAAANATSGNVYVVPPAAGQARYRLYNTGGTAEWIFGQKTGTDHDFKLSKLIAGSEVDYLAVTTAGILQFDSGYGSNANAYGCRAWANISAGATPSIRASGNVSSVTDAGSGVGDFLVSFTTAMPDANYAAVVTAGGAGTLASANAAVGWAAVYATGSVRIGITDNNTDTNVDTDYLNVAIFR
jgi:hypothetical protein